MNSIWTAIDEISRTLQAAKEALPYPGFEWYRYNSFSNLGALRKLLGSRHDALFALARSEGVLDIGCGDGDLSFLFASLGCKVTAIDHPTPNHNGMRGVHTLKQALKSDVSIHEVDLDTQFAMPGERYGLALFLGTLYHLKNPFYAVERIAKHCRYCLLSTRVARCFPNGSPMPKGEPIAYLLGPDELNQDETNYWIFTIPGLKRMLERAGWEVVEEFTGGDTVASRPTTLEHDQRVFFLLRSHFGLAHTEMLEGCWEAEESGWRWTKQHFSVRLKCDGNGSGPETLVLRVFIPDVLLQRLGRLTLSIAVDGVALEPAILSYPGRQTITRPLPPGAAERVIQFSLDKALRDAEFGWRELGIIVASLEVE